MNMIYLTDTLSPLNLNGILLAVIGFLTVWTLITHRRLSFHKKLSKSVNNKFDERLKLLEQIAIHNLIKEESDTGTAMEKSFLLVKLKERARHLGIFIEEEPTVKKSPIELRNEGWVPHSELGDREWENLRYVWVDGERQTWVKLEQD
jgi:hypothetical protein